MRPQAACARAHHRPACLGAGKMPPALVHTMASGEAIGKLPQRLEYASERLSQAAERKTLTMTTAVGHSGLDYRRYCPHDRIGRAASDHRDQSAGQVSWRAASASGGLASASAGADAPGVPAPRSQVAMVPQEAGLAKVGHGYRASCTSCAATSRLKRLVRPLLMKEAPNAAIFSGEVPGMRKLRRPEKTQSCCRTGTQPLWQQR